MKTLAAVLREINKPLDIEELIIPQLNVGQVLVKIAFSGVCRSQLNEIQGLKGEDKFLPHTLGHEGSGIVEAVGKGIKKVKIGDHVVLTWIKGSGADVPSSIYKRSNGSIVNSGAISTFLTRAVVSENRLVKIPAEMPLQEASLFGCAIPTGAGIVLNTAKIRPGSSVAIFGMGGIGLSALLGAKLVGAAVIIAVDLLDYKLEQVLQLGATHVINLKKQDILSCIMQITGGLGVDYAIEAAGKKESMEMAYKSVRNNGGLCVIAGNLSQSEQISINPFDLIKGRQIVGTWGGETHPDKDIPKYVDLALSGRLNLKNLIGHTCNLEDINAALDNLQSGEMGRILIDISAEQKQES